jgi:hypothetical protein
VKKSKLVLAALAAGTMAMTANPLFAAFSGSPVTNTINVRANVVAKCDVGGTTLDFGDFDPLAGVPGAATGQFSIQCTTGTVASITMAAITNMTNGTSTLTYQLGQNVGDTSWGTKVYTAASAASQMIDIYGILPASQPGATAIGVHTGTATVTVTF